MDFAKVITASKRVVFETFNSFIRAHRIYGNKRCDIAHKFALIELIWYICEEENLSSDER